MAGQTTQSVFSVVITAAHDVVLMDNDDIRDIYFIEDIYSYLMTGKMVCRDTRGLSEFLPLVGNEKITIEYGTTEGGGPAAYSTKIVEFDLIKMGYVENTNDKRRHFMEFFFIQSFHKRLHMEHYSKSYKCLRYTDYIADICKNHVGISGWNEFEHGIETLQYFYTGLKTPAKNIEWLASRTASAQSGQPGYLMFGNTQTEGNPMNFVSLETLLARKTLLVPEAGPYSIAAHQEYNINKFIKYKDKRVDKKSLEKLIRFINLGYDMKRKRYLKNEYFYKDALAKFTCLGKFSLFDEGIDSLASADQQLTAEVEEMEIMNNLYFGDWIKRYCLQHTVETLIEGHVDRYAGGMIKSHWPSANDYEVFDKNMTGMYLVKSITHYFCPLQKPVYMQKMILIKNGYDDSTGRLTGAPKQNLGVQLVDMSAYDNKAIRGL